jgi:signal peptidase II
MIWFILGVVCFALDIITKNYISSNFKIGESIPVIKDVFHITYHLNSGAAFSILQNKRMLLIIISCAVVSGLVAYLAVKKPENKLLLCALTLVLSGASGNLAGRIYRGVVVDFFDFRLINFPIFNIADCLVVIGAGLLILYVFKSEAGANGKD